MACNCENQNPPNNHKESLDRRSFMTRITLGVGAFFAAVLSFPLVAAMLDPIIRKKTEVWRSVGKLTDFKIGETKMVTFENDFVSICYDCVKKQNEKRRFKIFD